MVRGVRYRAHRDQSDGTRIPYRGRLLITHLRQTVCFVVEPPQGSSYGQRIGEQEMAGACPLFAEWQASTANDLDAFHTDLPLEVLLDVSSCTIHFSCTIYQPSCLLFISRDSSPTASSALSLAQLGHKTFSRGCLFAHVDIIQGPATVEASHWYDSPNS